MRWPSQILNVNGAEPVKALIYVNMYQFGWNSHQVYNVNGIEEES